MKMQSDRCARFCSLLLAGLATLMLAAASAQDGASTLPTYDVELVIFRHLSANATDEQWELEAAAAGQHLSIPSDDASPFEANPDPAAVTTPTTFPQLPAARFKLTAIEETLRRSRNFQPLAHFGWTQPGYPRSDARYMSVSSFVPPSSGIVGQVALSRGRYLHLTLDLVLTSQTEGGAQERYVLRQTRRMRSNERHYIDHPKFGVIAIITPVRNPGTAAGG